MILTNKQEQGLRVAVERYRNREPYTVIAGYAGSGKSTLVKFIVAALNLNDDDVAYVAFTGKAATVLRQKGCANAMTAHKLLYYSRKDKSGKFIFTPRKSLEGNPKLIVVDEVSMLPVNMWELLLEHRVHVLAMGDPGQLPPINKDQALNVLDTPHVFLDEIMRQAQESEIIRLSMHIREGKPLRTFQAAGQQVLIYHPSQVVSSMYDWADQVLCATNNKRHDINKLVRENRGFGPTPQVGDKIISLTNHWDDCSAFGGWALTNGAIGTLDDFEIENYHMPFGYGNMEVMRTTMLLEDGDKFFDIPVDYQQVITGNATLNSVQRNRLYKAGLEDPYDFAYAYAITAHKAQGSEWKKVLVFEEKFPYDQLDHIRWLYTAATRASEKLVIVSKS